MTSATLLKLSRHSAKNNVQYMGTLMSYHACAYGAYYAGAVGIYNGALGVPLQPAFPTAPAR